MIQKLEEYKAMPQNEERTIFKTNELLLEKMSQKINEIIDKLNELLSTNNKKRYEKEKENYNN